MCDPNVKKRPRKHVKMFASRIIFMLVLTTRSGHVMSSVHEVSSCFTYGSCPDMELSCPDSGSIYITQARYGFRYNTTSCPGRDGCDDRCCKADSKACFRPYSTSDLATLYTNRGCWGNAKCTASPGWQVGGCERANNSSYGYISCFATVTYACIKPSQMVDFASSNTASGSEVAVKYYAVSDLPLPDDAIFYCRVEARDCSRRVADVMQLKTANDRSSRACTSVAVGKGIGEGLGDRSWLPCLRRDMTYDVTQETTPFSLYLRLVASNSASSAWAVVTASDGSDLVVSCGYAINGDTSGGHCNDVATTISSNVTTPTEIPTTGSDSTTTISPSTSEGETSVTRAATAPASSYSTATNSFTSDASTPTIPDAESSVSPPTTAVSTGDGNMTTTTTPEALSSSTPADYSNSSYTPTSTYTTVRPASRSPESTTAGGGGGIRGSFTGSSTSSTTSSQGAQSLVSGEPSVTSTIIVVVVVLVVLFIIVVVIVFAVCYIGPRQRPAPRTESIATLEDELSDVIPMSVLQAVAAGPPPSGRHGTAASSNTSQSYGHVSAAKARANHVKGDAAVDPNRAANHSHGGIVGSSNASANERRGDMGLSPGRANPRHAEISRTRSQSTRPVQTRVRIITGSDDNLERTNRRSVPGHVASYSMDNLGENPDYDHLRALKSRGTKKPNNLYAHLGSSFEDDVTEYNYDRLSRDRIEVIDSPYDMTSGAAIDQNPATIKETRRLVGIETTLAFSNATPTQARRKANKGNKGTAESYGGLFSYGPNTSKYPKNALGADRSSDPPSYEMAMAEETGEGMYTNDSIYSLAQNIDPADDEEGEEDRYTMCQDAMGSIDPETDPQAYVDDEQIFGNFEDVRSAMNSSKTASRSAKPANDYVNVMPKSTAKINSIVGAKGLGAEAPEIEEGDDYSMAKPIQTLEEGTWSAEYNPERAAANFEAVYSLAGGMGTPAETLTASVDSSPASDPEEPDYYNTVALLKIKSSPEKSDKDQPVVSESPGPARPAEGSDENTEAAKTLHVQGLPTLMSRLVQELEQVPHPSSTGQDVSTSGCRPQSPVSFSSPKLARRPHSPASAFLSDVSPGQLPPALTLPAHLKQVGATGKWARETPSGSPQIIDPSSFVSSTLPRAGKRGPKPKILYPKPILNPRPFLSEETKSSSQNISTEASHPTEKQLDRPAPETTSPEDCPEYLELISAYGPDVPRRACALRRHRRRSDPTCGVAGMAAMTSSGREDDVRSKRRSSAAQRWEVSEEGKVALYELAKTWAPAEESGRDGRQAAGVEEESLYEVERPVVGEQLHGLHGQEVSEEPDYALARPVDQ